MLDKFGDYCMFMWRVIAIPDKWKVFFRRYLERSVRKRPYYAGKQVFSAEIHRSRRTHSGADAKP